ncbi:MAG: family 20 glycosylhydrolase [Elusimicrobiota bacterium]
MPLSTLVLPLSLSLMPVPSRVEPLEGRFRLTEAFTVSTQGPGRRLDSGSKRMLRTLGRRTGLFFAPGQASMLVRCRREGALKLGDDESYSLSVLPDKVELDAETDIGALRGMETLLQLLAADDTGYYLPAVRIQDKPRFPWRGLLIDCSRHFMPLDALKRNLDAMASVKLNVLHWHLTDDQGFRVESRKLPKLHNLGSDGLYYTQEQIREIIAYAADRGIRVVPEFDIPGHSTSWLVAYPELASLPGPYAIERHWGVFDPTFDPTRRAVYGFFAKFFKEMARLFPDEYIHIGGDENNGKQWDANPDIQEFKKKNGIPDNEALQSYFNQRILKILRKNGKKMIGWDDILHPDMPKDIVIQAWRGQEKLAEAAKQGYMGILSRGYYIDLIQPTDLHYLNDPLQAGSGLSVEEEKRVLGGEATMWAEMVDADTVDSRIWPRTAAIAERLWSPAEVKDVDDMYRRLDRVSFLLEDLGLRHRAYPETLLKHLAAGHDPAPLRVLMDVLEPVKIYARNEQRVYTSESPCTRVVDAAVPDAQAAREFRSLVDAYLADKSKDKADRIRGSLLLWKENHAGFSELARLSPVLREVEPLSAALSQAADSGLQALQGANAPGASYAPGTAGSGTAPAAPWNEDWAKPHGQAELMVLSAVQKLVQETAK